MLTALVGDADDGFLLVTAAVAIDISPDTDGDGVPSGPSGLHP